MTAKTVWIHHSLARSAWYELESSAKAQLREQWEDLDRTTCERGSAKIGEWSVRGQSDFSTVEIWEFDSPETAFQFWSDRVSADYAVWFAFSNQIGVEQPTAKNG